MSRAEPTSRHVPINDTDEGEFLREGAARSAGFRQGQHLAESRAELERNGGAEKVIDRAARRVERTDR